MPDASVGAATPRARPRPGAGNRGCLGSGTADAPAFFHALADLGYQTPITCESLSSAVAIPGLPHGLTVWHHPWSDDADLAAHARSYTADQFEAPRARLQAPTRPGPRPV
ncbi:hypothetical protein AB0B92_22580 [Streptomyces hygroscopicus]|uniref:hypothetical protein n=1 Tax=Streptomyces hygroscopicus TaxID=1912 RepID=UPI0034084D56